MDREAAQKNDDILYGSNSLREALRQGRQINRVWIARDKNDRITAEIIGRCHEKNIPYSKVDKAALDRICGNVAHQGFVARVSPKEYSSWRQMLTKAAESGQAPLIIMLADVEDPQNLGAALRSAEALGAHGIVLPKHRAAPLTFSTANASAGALEYVMVDRVTNLSRCMDEMKEEGLWVLGAAVTGGQPVYDADLTIPLCIVVGGESKGLSPLLLRKCDLLISIPMSGEINSLNVSAALAAILSETCRQRSRN